MFRYSRMKVHRVLNAMLWMRCNPTVVVYLLPSSQVCISAVVDTCFRLAENNEAPSKCKL